MASDSESRRNYYLAHKEKWKGYAKKRRENHAVEDREIKRRWKENNRDKVLASKRRYREQNKEKAEWREREHDHRIKVSGKDVTLKSPPRKDICSECGAVGPFKTKSQKRRRTSIIHDSIIDPQDPMKYTKEVCATCHARLNASKKWSASH